MFLNDLDAKLINSTSHEGRGTWKLNRPLRYYSKILHRVIVVPKGFETDLASIPRLPFVFWLLGDTASPSAVVHDYCYSEGHPVTKSRAVADAILREAAISDGVPSWRAWPIYFGVRCFGWMYWSKR